MLRKIFNIYEDNEFKVITIFGININIKKHPGEIEKLINFIPIKRIKKLILYFDKKLDNVNKNIIDFQKYMEALELARKIHKDTFLKYKDIYTNKDIVLIGNGPTAKNYIRINNAIHIGVNRAFYLENINLDYLFIQDAEIYSLLDESLKKKFNNVIKFYGQIDRRFYDRQITVPEKYYNNNNVYKYILNCQFFQYDHLVYDISSFPLGDFSSVIFPAIQFAFWTNPRRIFLVGCDMTYDGHFYDNKKNALNFNKMMLGWNNVKELNYNYYPDTKIISINPIGLKGMFKDIYTNNDEYIYKNGNIFKI